MKDTIIDIQSEKLPYFQGFFSGFASVRFSGVLKIERNRSLLNHQIDIIGPFLFAQRLDKHDFFFIFLPDYFVRDVLERECFELIPRKPVLVKKIKFFTKSTQEKTEWLGSFGKSISSIIFLPSTIPPVQFPVEIYGPEKNTVLKANFLMNVDTKKLKEACVIIEKSPTSQTKIPTSLDFMISSGFEFDNINIPEKSSMIVLYGISKSGSFEPTHYLFVEGGIDRIMTTYIESSYWILKTKSDQLNHKIFKRSVFAKDFPEREINMEITEGSPLDSKFVNNEMVIKSPESYVTTKIEFSQSKCNVPRAATHDLVIYDFNEKKGKCNRTVLIHSKVQRTLTRITEKTETSLDDSNISFDLEIAKIKSNMKCELQSSLEMEDTNSLFGFAELNDKEFFGKQGQYLINDCFDAPYPHDNFIKQEKLLKLELLTDRNMLSDQPILQKLIDDINSLPLNVNCESFLFTEICLLIGSILTLGTDPYQLMNNLTNLFSNDTDISACFPVGYNEFPESLLMFIYRLIFSKRIVEFFSIFIQSMKWRRKVYPKASIIYTVNFYTNLLAIVTQLNNHNYSGRFNGKFQEIKTDLTIERIDYAIRDDILNIVKNHRYGFNKGQMKSMIFNLLYDITCFFKQGFIHTSHNISADCWEFFKMTAKMDYQIPEFSIFKFTVDKLDFQKDKIIQLLVPQCILSGIKTGSLPIWILFLAKTAVEMKTHDPNKSLIYYREPVLIVSDSLRMMESILVELETSELIQCLELF